MLHVNLTCGVPSYTNYVMDILHFCFTIFCFKSLRLGLYLPVNLLTSFYKYWHLKHCGATREVSGWQLILHCNFANVHTISFYLND